MHKKVWLLLFLSALFVFPVGCGAKEDVIFQPRFESVGVWWWDDKMAGEQYLNFCAENGVTEIYFCTDNFGEQLAAFVRTAASRNIGVYALAGDYRYLADPSPLERYLASFRVYQGAYPDALLLGVHLDVEPHQHPEFDARREELLAQYAAFVGRVCSEGDIAFDFDIPFWLDDVVATPAGRMPVNRYVIETAARAFVMSYRDSAEQILKVAEDELCYAAAAGKPLFLSVETNRSGEGDAVTFYEEGKRGLYGELDRLAAFSGGTVSNIAVHHMKSWFDLPRG